MELKVVARTYKKLKYIRLMMVYIRKTQTEERIVIQTL